MPLHYLLANFIIDRYGYDSHEYERQNHQHEYGISFDDWKNQYDDEVKAVVDRIWTEADAQQRQTLRDDCVKFLQTTIDQYQKAVTTISATKDYEQGTPDQVT